MIKLIERNSGKVIIRNFGEVSAILKSRINDPNKQLIKLFVHLIGLMFEALNDKDLKFYFRPFVGALVEGLSDKMEGNRK